MGILVNCCPSGYLMNESLTCVLRSTNASGVVAEKVGEGEFKCLYNKLLVVERYITMDNSSEVTFGVEDMCIADTLNGSKIIAKCDNQHHSSMLGLGEIVFFGTQTYMPMNVVHMILCFVVVLVYLSVPELGRGLYNRAVIRHNISLLMQGVILQLLACCAIMNYRISSDHVLIFLWLGIQYFTIATVFWLNIICFDMTLAIMRFRWIAGGGAKSGEDEARKLMMYSIFGWIGPLLPTLLAGLCDYIPQVPNDFVLKPNYVNYMKGPSSIVFMYFFALPTLVLLFNNILFICTTYRIIQIQRSTEIATRNQKNILTKKYFLFLRLYLSMGAPWFFGVLLACFKRMIFLKICRIIQPLLWLLMLTSHKELVKKVKGFFMECKHRRKDDHSLPPTEVTSSHL